jgi:pimeloyl-ACP methyl ester carboxylesterase
MKQLPQYRFISLSLPCFGDSTKDPTYDSYPKQAAAVVAFLDQLGIDQLNVIGHSMSSVLAQVMVLVLLHGVRKVHLLLYGATLSNCSKQRHRRFTACTSDSASVIPASIKT